MKLWSAKSSGILHIGKLKAALEERCGKKKWQKKREKKIKIICSVSSASTLID